METNSTPGQEDDADERDPDPDPAVATQASRGENAEAYEPEDENGKLEDHAHGEDERRREGEVLARSELRVVELRVESDQEVDRVRTDLPISDSRLGPKTSSSTSARTINPCHPMKPGMSSFVRLSVARGCGLGSAPPGAFVLFGHGVDLFGSVVQGLPRKGATPNPPSSPCTTSSCAQGIRPALRIGSAGGGRCFRAALRRP